MNRSPLVALSAATALALAAGCAKPTAPVPGAYQKPAGADRYVRAVAELKSGDQEAAIRDLEQAVVVNPSLRMARMTLGELYLARKEYARAVPHLQAASDLDPYTLRNHYNLGLSLQVLSRFPEAALAYLRGLKLDPDDFKSNVNLGLVYFALNHLDASIYHLEKASRVEPDNARAWSNVGVVYDARGNAVLAEASYRRAMELDPANESTMINLTANLIAQKKPADAVAIAELLVKQNDSPLSRKRLGDAHASGRQWDRAFAAYDGALARDAKFVPALNAKAEAYAAQFEAELRLNDGLRKQAVATWNQSLTLRPDQDGVRENVARYADTKVFR